jgi:CBS domain-containing protein
MLVFREPRYAADRGAGSSGKERTVDVSKVMKRKVASIRDDATLAQAIERFIVERVGMLPVLDEQSHVVGVITLHDILHLAFPHFVDLIEDFDFVHDFGALEAGEISAEVANSRITEYMSPPLSCAEDCGLLRAEAVMRQHRVRDLPVVDEDQKLVGLASWVDVGTAFLEQWAAPDDS